MIKFPKNWRAVEQDGELLYLTRVCGRYYVMPECGEWHAYHHPEGVAIFCGAPIGKGQTRDHALLLCREHLHANQQVSNNAAKVAGEG